MGDEPGEDETGSETAKPSGEPGEDDPDPRHSPIRKGPRGDYLTFESALRELQALRELRNLAAHDPARWTAGLSPNWITAGADLPRTLAAELLASRPDASDPIWITPDMAPTALLGALNVSRVHSIRIETRYGDDRYQIRAEVPGIDPKDIDVDVKDGLLHIQARRYSEQDDVEDDVEWTGRRSEFAYGTFTRVVPLPEGADEDDIQADYRLGVLTITVGISGSIPSPRRIEIRSSESRSPRRMP